MRGTEMPMPHLHLKCRATSRVADDGFHRDLVYRIAGMRGGDWFMGRVIRKGTVPALLVSSGSSCFLLLDFHCWAFYWLSLYLRLGLADLRQISNTSCFCHCFAF